MRLESNDFAENSLLPSCAVSSRCQAGKSNPILIVRSSWLSFLQQQGFDPRSEIYKKATSTSHSAGGLHVTKPT